MNQKNSKKRNETPAVTYLLERLEEVLKEHADAEDVIVSGYQYMMLHFEDRMVDPKFTRDVESLEAILFSFVTHCASESALNELNNHMGSGRKIETLQ